MGTLIQFSLDDFTRLQEGNEYLFPKNFAPAAGIDPQKYAALEQEFDARNRRIGETFEGLRKRTGTRYFRKVYPAQCAAHHFSETAFPAYRFLMPDVIIDDWLAIVDFHKSYGRDHALHQPLTAYIVFRLLGGGVAENSLRIHGRNLLDLCVDQIFHSPRARYLHDYLRNIDPATDLSSDTPLNRAVWQSLFYETAMVAAIFHDIGYPWQYINRLNKSLRAGDFNLRQPELNAKFIHANFGNRLVMLPFRNYETPSFNAPCGWQERLMEVLSEALAQTHGLPGALGFLYLQDAVRRYPCDRKMALEQLCIEWAALGISMHDMGSVYRGKGGSDLPAERPFLRLAFDRDPLSCIIALADVLEEFERPAVGFQEERGESVRYTYEHACASTKLEVKNDTLQIDYCFCNERYRIRNLPFKRKEEKEYFDPQHGYLDLTAIGIRRVSMSCLCQQETTP